MIGLREYHTRLKVHFEIEMQPEVIEKYSEDPDYFAKLFKTNGSISMNNMVGFNETKSLKRYDKISDVLNEFYGIRLKYYSKRKDYLLSRLVRELEILTMK